MVEIVHPQLTSEPGDEVLAINTRGGRYFFSRVLNRSEGVSTRGVGKCYLFRDTEGSGADVMVRLV